MNKIISVLLVLVLFLSALSFLELDIGKAYAFTDEVMISDNTTSDYVGNFNFAYQTFTSPSTPMYASAIELYMNRYYSASVDDWDYYLTSANESTNKPIGTEILAEGSVNMQSISDGAYSWQKWSFDEVVELEPDTLYALCWCISTGSTYPRYYKDSGNAYGGGTRGYGDSQDIESINWSISTGEDVSFRLYGLSDISGQQSQTYYISSNDDDAWLDSGDTHPWVDACDGEVVVLHEDDELNVGWWEETNVLNQRHWNIYESILGFDIGTMPADDIVGAELYLYANDHDDDTGLKNYYGVVLKSIGVSTTIDELDFDLAYSAPRGILASDGWTKYQDIELDEYYCFDLMPDVLELDSNGYLWFYLMAGKHYYGIEPEDCTGFLEDNQTWIEFQDQNSTYEPYLILYYEEDADEGDDGGDFVNTSDNGTKIEEIDDGVIVSIDWESPRCAYSSQNMCFVVEGTPGTPFVLQLQTEEGVVLSYVDESVYSNGYYMWDTDVTSSYTGFIRVVEVETSSVSSDWGYLYNGSPLSNMNVSSAVFTDSNYINEEQMRSYAVVDGDIATIHWKSNVDVNYLYNYGLSIYQREDESVYSTDNLSAFFEDYYLGIEDNEWSVNSRYVVVRLQNSANDTDYDDLVIDLDCGSSSDDYGYYVLSIDDSDDIALNEYSTALWFLPRYSDALYMIVSDNNEDITVNCQYGSLSHLADDLPSVTLSTLNNGQVITSSSGLLTSTNQDFVVTKPSVNNYEMMIEFSGSNDYIHTWYLTYSSTLNPSDDRGLDVGGWLEGLMNGLDDIGMNNVLGHWIIIISLMVICYLMLRQDRVLRVIIPLAVFGAGIALSWVDLWIVVLLAIGIGFTVFKVVRPKIGG